MTAGIRSTAWREAAGHRGSQLPLLTDLGEEASKALFTFVDAGHPNSPDAAQDNTHLSLTRAVKLAEIALELLKTC